MLPFVPAPKPTRLAEVPATRQVALDVREDLRQGREPFRRIMAAVEALGEDQVLVLRAPFEPVPLFGVMARRGFAHWTEHGAADDWVVWFYREAPHGAAPPGGAVEAPSATPDLVRLDVRGLEPPEPMVRILEALERLGPGQRLEVVHERRPLFLYPQLDDRGFRHQTEELAPGHVRIVIQRGRADG